MKKYDGKHRKKISKRKREILYWRKERARARGLTVKEMLQHLDTRADPLRQCVRYMPGIKT
jgi:hypothetical protein